MNEGCVERLDLSVLGKMGLKSKTQLRYRKKRPRE